MRLRKKYTATDKPEIAVGNILVAKPFWQAEIYKRSVIMIFRTDVNKIRGIILNKISSVSLNEAVPDFGYHTPLYFGGVHSVQSVSCIHSNENVPGSYPLGNGLFFGGDYDYITEMYQNGYLSLDDFRFYVGCVEWDVDQLTEELNDDKWWLSNLSIAEFYSNTSEHFWSDKLIRENHMYGLFDEWPDPSLC